MYLFCSFLFIFFLSHIEIMNYLVYLFLSVLSFCCSRNLYRLNCQFISKNCLFLRKTYLLLLINPRNKRNTCDDVEEYTVKHGLNDIKRDHRKCQSKRVIMYKTIQMTGRSETILLKYKIHCLNKI